MSSTSTRPEARNFTLRLRPQEVAAIDRIIAARYPSGATPSQAVRDAIALADPARDRLEAAAQAR